MENNNITSKINQNTSLIGNLLSWVRCPDINSTQSRAESDYKVWQKVLMLMQIWTLAVFLNIFVAIVGQKIMELTGNTINPEDHAVAAFTKDNPWWVILATVGILAPISEEFIFRFWLAPQNYKSKKSTAILVVKNLNSMSLRGVERRGNPFGNIISSLKKFITKILAPIYNFITRILGTVFSAIFGPIIRILKLQPRQHWRFNLSFILIILFSSNLFFSESQVAGFLDQWQKLNESAGEYSNLVFKIELFGVILGLIILINYFLNTALIQKIIGRIYSQYSSWLFWVATLGFGVVHITNFTKLPMSSWIFIPLLVLPQIITGFILGYIRVNFGFRWAVLFHGIFNSILTLPIILIGLFPQIGESRDIKVENMTFAESLPLMVFGLGFVIMFFTVIVVNFYTIIEFLVKRKSKVERKSELGF
jgi:uncharacterized protein